MSARKDDGVRTVGDQYSPGEESEREPAQPTVVGEQQPVGTTNVAQQPQGEDATGTAEELKAHGISISWSLTGNGWQHVVWDEDRQVYASEFYDDALQHARTYASGKLGVPRTAIPIPAAQGSASSGDRIDSQGGTAIASEQGSQGQVSAFGTPPATIRDNLVDEVPGHRRDAAAEGAHRTAQAARNDSGPEASANKATRYGVDAGPEPADTPTPGEMAESADRRMEQRRRADPFAPIDHTQPANVWTGETARANDPNPQASTGTVNPQADEVQVFGDRLDPRSDEIGIQKDQPMPEGISMGAGVPPQPAPPEGLPPTGTDRTDATVEPDATAPAEDDEAKRELRNAKRQLDRAEERLGKADDEAAKKEARADVREARERVKKAEQATGE